MGLPSRVIVVSASSDIGSALCEHWIAQGAELFGTFRTDSPAVAELKLKGATLVACDLTQGESVRNACAQLRQIAAGWQILVVAPGTTEPVGLFAECDFADWESSIRVNFTAQMELIHGLLPARGSDIPLGASVILFAGGGTNDAPRNYSAYIVSKIALMKMCELLDAEMPDVRFSIVGPGWVKTKIHEATLRAGEKAGANYHRVVDRLRSGEGWTPMERVVDCCDWIVRQSREVVGGRNFSVVFDAWSSAELQNELVRDPNLYKLRRYGNDRLVRDVFARS